MRFIVTGLLLLLIPSFASAQVTGEVQSIGFDGAFRPNCWTPMKVRIVPEGTDPAEYVIAVYQHDMDGDRPIYTRPIVLNGSSGTGKGSEQRFWTYFLPQPIQKGLPDAGNNNSNSGSLRSLQRDLQVFLCKPGNPPKPIVELPLTSTVQSVDPYRDNYNNKPRSSKLILSVSASGAKPTINERDAYNRAVGVMEDVQVVSLRMDELPEDPIGYEAVDAVIWLDGNPADMQGGNLDSYAALKDYVRFGGHLVICQSPSNWQENQSFGDLLPVDVSAVSNKSNFEPLASMAAPRGVPDPFHMDPLSSWSLSKGPYQMARSTARSGAVVEKWIDWKQDGSFSDATPYLARKSFGSGQVTWVAHSLTNAAAPGNATAWPYIWDQVMGWKNNSYVVPPDKADDDYHIKDRVKTFAPAGPNDLGFALTRGLDLSSKANWLILLAVFFFIAYWVIAGPGSYLYLATKKRQAMSWFFFGIAALGATAITVLVVKIVLRGPPEIRHISFVRLAPGQPAFVHSRFGLYIPRDGSQRLALSETSPSSVSYLSPFAEHPQQLGGDATEFPSPTDYYVPVRDLKTESQPDLTVDYRSSSKKFQARWVGDWANRIVGDVKLDPENHSLHLAGTLTNASGIDLSDIFMAFNADDGIDYMIYVPDWPKGTSYDIARDFAKHGFAGHGEGNLASAPGDKKIICDFIDNPNQKGHGWAELWYSHFHLRGGGDDPNVDDGNMNYIFPLLSVLDRVPAMPNVKTISASSRVEWSEERVEFYNRGARMFNASSSIAAGQLVILANSHGALPIPLTVDDSKMQGEGTVFYQFILPIDRGKVEAPTTKPAK